MAADTSRLTWRGAIAADARAANLWRTIGLITLIVAMIYEWGSGNETVNVTVIANAYESRGGIAGIAAATVVGGVVPAILQILTGTIAAIGFASVTNTTNRSWEAVLRLRPELAGSSWLGLPIVGQFAIAFGLGASVSVLTEQMTTGRSGLKVMQPVIVRSAIYTGFGASALSFVMTSTAELARQFDRTRPAADFLLRWATNPLVWFVAFTLLAVWAWWVGRSDLALGLSGEAGLDERLERG